MIFDDSYKTGQQGKIVLLHKMYGDFYMAGIEARQELYQVAIKLGSDTANKDTDIRPKPLPKRLGHCRNETLLSSLP